MMSWRGRVITTMTEYYDGSKVTVYPWAHPLMTIVGLVYVFEDRKRKPFLVYMAPGDDGTTIRVHYTDVEVQRKVTGVKLISMPDLDNDPAVVVDAEGVFHIDPAPND